MREELAEELVLSCEYAQSPLGLDVPNPRFGWKGVGKLAEELQYSYQITVRQGAQILWNSGVVISKKTNAVRYEGPALVSATRYYWNVKVTMESGAVCEAEDWFEMGLMQPSDWQGAQWIGHPQPQRGVAPLLRRSFHLKTKPSNARLYLSGIGYARVTVNGKTVDDSWLDPGWTDYQKTVLYRAWDVTQLLQPGENVLSVELGEGWYGNDHPNFINLVRSMPSWLNYPEMICLLQADTQVVCVSGDDQWLVSDGAIRKNNIFDGEWYDACQEQEGWQLPGFIPDANRWQPALIRQGPGGRLRCQQIPFIGKKRLIKPVYVTYPDAGDAYEVVADLGVNIAGWAEITVSGKKGQKVELRYAEILDSENAVDQRNLRGAKATDTFILGKDGSNTYEPRFTYHGFRYLQIKTDSGVTITNIRGWQVHSLVEQVGAFHCDNLLLQKIYDALLQTEQNNLHSVPTDCPQRDERLGWVNDMTVRCEEGLYNFDMARFYEKWLRDLADSQDPQTGAIPDTAPYFFGGRPGFHVTSVYVILPWLMYWFYEDQTAIEQHFAGMERYVAFKLSQRDENGLISNVYFGDWAAPMTESLLGWGENAVPLNNPQQLVTTCYLCYDCQLMAKMAEILNMPEKKAYYEALADEVGKAINNAFYHEEGYYAGNAQGSNVFPLFLNLVPQEKKGQVMQNILHDLFVERDGRHSTGNQMTKYMFEVFAREGHHDDAFRLATYDRYPSIAFMFQHGATTIWERWERMAGNHMNSHNHPMLGAFTVWFQKGICGLNPQVRTRDGRLLLRPNLVKALSKADATMGTPRGPVSLGWERIPEGLRVRVEVPWGDTLDVELPMEAAILDGRSLEKKQTTVERLTPGIHEIICH